MEEYGSPTVVRRLFRQGLGRDPPSRLTVRRIYQRSVETGSVANNYRGNVGRPRWTKGTGTPPGAKINK